MTPPIAITGVILAGGASHRMGGQDKGLLDLHGRPLVAWLIEALAPQVDEIIIVANRNLERYSAFGHKVVSDLRPDFAGPLAGFEAALHAARCDWVLTCPTDAPFLPADYAKLMCGQASPAVVTLDEFWQPVYSLLPRSSLAQLSQSLDQGERKAQRWLSSLSPRLIALDHHAAALRDADDPAALKTLADSLRAAD